MARRTTSRRSTRKTASRSYSPKRSRTSSRRTTARAPRRVSRARSSGGSRAVRIEIVQVPNIGVNQQETALAAMLAAGKPVPPPVKKAKF
jgi:hypothetical protein